MKYYVTKEIVADTLCLTRIRLQDAEGNYILNGSDIASLDVEMMAADGYVKEITLAEAKQLIKKAQR